MSKFRKLAYIIGHAARKPFYGFVEGHGHLASAQLSRIKSLIGAEQPDIVSQFEAEFAALVGKDGEAVSFAAARMAFFALMKSLGIGKTDEVILPGATCAVMVNAVLRIGATPVFSDVDIATFGSSVEGIRARITSRTKLIVAQHSFGIPCDIAAIVLQARSAGIFLVEDCALTVGSTVGGVAVGNFGDAALFSVDRTKPLNAMTGGLLFSRDKGLLLKVRAIQRSAGELPLWKQNALWKRLLRERRYCTPGRYGRLAFYDLIVRVVCPWTKRPFLDQDFGTTPGGSYPYPARMPAFLAAVGREELQRWPLVAANRRAILRDLLSVARATDAHIHLPAIYNDPNLDIVPLRLAWSQEDGAAIRHRVSAFVDVPWTWFMEPIVGTRGSYADYGYRDGDCPIAETIGPGMINLPCNFAGDVAPLVTKFRRMLTQSS